MKIPNNVLSKRDVSNAFKKLQSFVYFDNYDLLLREKIANYKSNIETNINSFISEVQLAKPFREHFSNSIGLTFLPKKVDCKSELENGFYTNAKISSANEINKPLVFCDLPIELHLVSVIWIIKYGPLIESKLSKNAVGNRLIISKTSKEVVPGKSLFKPYVRQFQNWWSRAIKETKLLLEKDENATIINFDLRSFYHEVRFSFNELEESFPELKSDPIHQILKKIHKEYGKLILNFYKEKSDDKYPLPIGLLSSHVLANWYLSKLDKFIEKKIRPVYYGRYVDDVLIVVKDTLLEREEIQQQLELGKANDSTTILIEFFLKQYFGDVFSFDDSDNISIKLKGLENLKLNKSKLFVYQFDSENSPNLIEKFVDEQKERASMFRFLSDEEDESFDNFEKITFESNFDQIDANKARFKNLEDNKFKLSSFFSKLIKRKILKGDNYRIDEVDKILKYFKGSYLIKHYQFWEKLFTLLLVYNQRDNFKNLVEEINQEIENIESSPASDEVFKIGKEMFQKSLRKVLKLSICMAVGLKPEFLKNNRSLVKTIVKSVENDNIPKTRTDIYFERLFKDYRIFRDSGLLRNSFVYYSLIQFTEFTKETDQDLTSSDSIFTAIKLLNGAHQLDIVESSREYVPIRVKFWQVALWAYYKNIISELPSSSPNNKLWLNDRYFSGPILDDAFDVFSQINSLIDPIKTKDQYFVKSYSGKNYQAIEDTEKRFPPNRHKNYIAQEILLANGGKAKDNIKVCIVNKYVDLRDFEKSLKGHPENTSEKQEIFDRIIDDVTKVGDCDLFVMPELSLPHRLITRFTQEATKSQIRFTTGVEHLNVHNCGLNFILTVLPININGEKDSIPILRLKNHYAPEEEEWIRGFKMMVPKPNPYRYDLLIWRGLYFAPYYCFELADLFHRSAFFSKVDAIIAPVWNSDTHYYNNLIDSATRDMHNFFVLVNTAQYGFSKISRPRDHIHKEKLVVKGGTEEGYPYTLLIGNLKIKELRQFQALDYHAQKERNSSKKSFKPTPPDFITNDVKKRMSGLSVLTKDKS